MAATAPSQPTDPELQSTGWDLEPLVGGEGPELFDPRLGRGRVVACDVRYRFVLDIANSFKTEK